jgi:tetratricopeptide (TPR) repeat protein
MSGQVVRPSLRGRLYRLARDVVARGLLAEGNRIWSEEPHEIDRAIAKVEQAWALTADPAIAVQLATMYDQANRNQEALVVLRDAFRRNPRHALVRHHAAITLLRHGSAAEIRDFFDSVLKIDPDDAFARFVVSLLDSYDGWVDELASSIRRQHDGRQPFIISCPVWGQAFADDFVRYSCAALLSPNNLPKLAERCSIHIVIFTTAATANHLSGDPLFARLGEYATVRFVRYSDAQVNYRQAMEAHYGHEVVAHSDQSLAFYYERNCKFALMSCAHYAALAAGRATDALVSCQVADTLLNDGALTFMADRMAGGAAAVLVNCIQMDGAVLRSVLDDKFRHGDGVIQIPSESCVKILSAHLPPYNLAGVGNLPQIPLRVCWRVGAHGILVHGNHYHPFCLRPKAFTHPLQLTATECRSNRQPVHRSLLARYGPDSSGSGRKRRRTVNGGWSAAGAICAQSRATLYCRGGLLVMGVLGPAARRILSHAAAPRPRDITRRMGASGKGSGRRRRCHRQAGRRLRRTTPGQGFVAFVTTVTRLTCSI